MRARNIAAPVKPPSPAGMATYCSRRKSCAVAAVAPFGSDAAAAVGPPTRLIAGALARLLRAPMAFTTSAVSQDPHSAAPAQRGSVQSRFAEALARRSAGAQLTVIVSLDFSKPLLILRPDYLSESVGEGEHYSPWMGTSQVGGCTLGRFADDASISP